MPKNWKTYKIKDVVNQERGISYGIVQPGNHYPNGIPIVKINNLTNSSFNIKDLQCVTPKVESKYKRTRLEGGELLLSLVGTLGEIYHVPKEMKGMNVVRALAVIPILQEFSPRWVEYCLKSPLIQNQLNQIATTSVQATINLKEFREVEIQFPEKTEREAIATILSALDDKIELNLQMNKTLEEMAMALYKHWFVDFGPFQNGKFVESELGLIPEGWEVKRLKEVANKKSDTFKFSNKEEVVFVNTGDVQEGRFLHSNKISKEGLPGQAKKAISKYDILYSEIRPKNKRYAYVNFESSDYVVSTKFMIINPKPNILNRLLYRILTMQSTVDNFDSIAEGRSGTFPQITFGAISEMQIILPPLNIQQEFQDIVSPIELQQDELFLENQTLTTLRDTLLPKLISGEVRIKDIEQWLVASL